MTHYFSENNDTLKSNPKEITFMLYDKQFKMMTDYGVFSKNELDFATELLLKSIVLPKEKSHILDMGCGYGVIGIVLAKIYGIVPDMVDINNRAIELAKTNSSKNNVSTNIFKSNVYDSIDGPYDVIITNPPIRAGKEIVHRIFEGAYEKLEQNGELWIVINKKHGAESAKKKLIDIFQNVELINRKKGFHVFKCKKTLTI